MSDFKDSCQAGTDSKKDLISSKLNLSSFFAGIELISKDKSILSINEIVLPSLTSPFIRLIDVTKLKVSGFSVPIFLTICETVRHQVPGCKFVLSVDENADPKLADKVARCKKDGLIDAFVYNSTSERYLAAILDSV